MMKKYEVLEGSTFGEPVMEPILVGYDWETGDEEYEYEYIRSWDPHERVIQTFTDYEEAKELFMNRVDIFSDMHTWPWNNPHYEFHENDVTAEFTNNEDLYWFKLRTINEDKDEA